MITRNAVFTGVHDALVGWLIDQRTTTIHMPDADRLSIRDHTAIYEAVASRDSMRAFHEMTGPPLMLISELYRESKRLSEDILRQVRGTSPAGSSAIGNRCGRRGEGSGMRGIGRRNR